MLTAYLVAGIALFMWALPLSHTLSASPLSAHDHARIAQLFVLLAACAHWAWLIARDAASPRVRPIGVGKWSYCAVVGGLVAASTLHATYPLVALRELLLFAGLLALSHSIAQMLVQQESFALLFRMLVVGGGMYSGSVLTLILVALFTGGPFDPWMALIGFDNPRFLNHAQTAALPLLTIVAASDRDIRWRRAALVTLLLSGMLLFLTYGRATMLALTAGLLTARWAFGSRANAYSLRALIPTLLGMLLMWLIYLRWMQGAGYNIEVDQLTQPHHRGHLIGQAIKLWKTSPWLGVGPMHFSHWEDGDAAHPHNVYAQVLAEYGAPGFVLILTGAVAWMFKHLRALLRVSPTNTATAIGLWGALVGVAVDGGFSGNFVMPISQLWIALTVGVVIAFVAVHGLVQDDNASRSISSTATYAMRTASSWILLLCMGWLCVQSALLCWRTPFPSMGTSGPIQGEWRVVTTSNPRFWSKGFF